MKEAAGGAEAATLDGTGGAPAVALDSADPLRTFRERFHFPPGPDGRPAVYLCGNSLGLQPKRAADIVREELEDWARLGVEGHFAARRPWLPYHERLSAPLAGIVGAKTSEVVVMNSLTVNLHLLMVSFYRPTKGRFKIVIEDGAFPSDRYAVESQARFHAGHAKFDSREAVVALKPRAGEETVRTEDAVAAIEKLGDSLALVLLGQVNYLTGQAFDVPALAAAARKSGAVFGLDLAHGAGNLRLQLHDWGVDFAAWCSYKYLNGGPGALGGIFVHERHAKAGLPRFEGWWGHDKKERFKMGPRFHGMEGAEGWQLSNPPILSMAPLVASFELFDEAGMERLRAKSEKLTAYLETRLAALPAGAARVLTPRDSAARGCQLSIRVKGDARKVRERLGERGFVCDLREPDVIRVAPVPLYNSFADAQAFAAALGEEVGRR